MRAVVNGVTRRGPKALILKLQKEEENRKLQENEERRKAYVARVTAEIAECEQALAHDFPKFYWEILGEEERKRGYEYRLTHLRSVLKDLNER